MQITQTKCDFCNTIVEKHSKLESMDVCNECKTHVVRMLLDIKGVGCEFGGFKYTKMSELWQVLRDEAIERERLLPY